MKEKIGDIVEKIKSDIEALGFPQVFISANSQADIDGGDWVNVVVEKCDIEQMYNDTFSKNIYSIKVEICYASLDHLSAIEMTERIMTSLPDKDLRSVGWSTKTGQLGGKLTEFFVIDLESALGINY